MQMLFLLERKGCRRVSCLHPSPATPESSSTLTSSVMIPSSDTELSHYATMTGSASASILIFSKCLERQILDCFNKDGLQSEQSYLMLPQTPNSDLIQTYITKNEAPAVGLLFINVFELINAEGGVQKSMSAYVFRLF